MLLGLTLLLLSAEPPLPSGVPAPVKGPNPYLHQAKELFQQLDFEKCLKRLQQAPQWKTEAPELLEIELLAGMCHYNLNQRPDAEERFRLALRMNPDAELPPYSSPKLVDFFLAVKRKMRAAPPPMPKEDLDLQKEKEKEKERQDKERLEKERQEALEREMEREKEREPEPLPPPKPKEDEPRVEVKPKLVPPPKPPPPPVEPEPPSVFARRPVPLVIGAAAVVAAGVGIGLGVNSRSLEAQARAAHFESDYVAYGDAARGNALGANVAFAVAGTAAAVAVVTWLLSGD